MRLKKQYRVNDAECRDELINALNFWKDLNCLLAVTDTYIIQIRIQSVDFKMEPDIRTSHCVAVPAP